MYEKYNFQNDLWGLPQVYKDVEFFPVKLMDVNLVNIFHKIFQIPKKYISDREIVKISYLKFLLYYVQYGIDPKGTEISNWIKSFLKEVTRKNVEIAAELLQIEGVQDFDRLSLKLIIGDVSFSEKEFDIIREIVLLQNGSSVDYIEEFDPELEKRLAFNNRKFSNLTFEDEIWIFCSLMNKTIFDIKEYTLYQFKKHFERLVLVHNFNLYSPLEVSGQISAKEGSSNKEVVKHYLSHMEKESRYESIIVRQQDFIDNNTKLFDSNFIHNQ